MVEQRERGGGKKKLPTFKKKIALIIFHVYKLPLSAGKLFNPPPLYFFLSYNLLCCYLSQY